jgi:DNA-binding transcriptional MocR family regulator
VTGPRAARYAQAAAIVRAQVADGTLKPGQPAPSGAHLARVTGFSSLTCRKALQTLVADGVLIPGTSPNARPRVSVPGGPPDGDAARALSRALAARRRARGLTQPDLAALSGYSVTTIGHAETGRLWQSREFWEKADASLAAGGELASLHDAYLAETAAAGEASQVTGQPAAPETPAGPAALVCVTLHWSDGTATSVPPPVTVLGS